MKPDNAYRKKFNEFIRQKPMNLMVRLKTYQYYLTNTR